MYISWLALDVQQQAAKKMFERKILKTDAASSNTYHRSVIILYMISYRWWSYWETYSEFQK